MDSPRVLAKKARSNDQGSETHCRLVKAEHRCAIDTAPRLLHFFRMSATHEGLQDSWQLKGELEQSLVILLN